MSASPAAMRQARSAYSAQVWLSVAASPPSGRQRSATASGRALTVSAKSDGIVRPATIASMSCDDSPMLSPFVVGASSGDERT